MSPPLTLPTSTASYYCMPCTPTLCGATRRATHAIPLRMIESVPPSPCPTPSSTLSRPPRPLHVHAADASDEHPEADVRASNGAVRYALRVGPRVCRISRVDLVGTLPTPDQAPPEGNQHGGRWCLVGQLHCVGPMTGSCLIDHDPTSRACVQCVQAGTPAGSLAR